MGTTMVSETPISWDISLTTMVMHELMHFQVVGKIINF